MRQISIISIKAPKNEYDWHVSQRFEIVSGKIITVNGWGFSRRSALENFEQEKNYAMQDELDSKYTLLDKIAYLLWDFAGKVDKIIAGENNHGKR